MQKLPLYIIISFCLYSCSLPSEQFSNNKETDSVQKIRIIKKKPLDLNYYAKEMTHNILNNISHVNSTSSIVTTSFIFVDGDYQTSPVFARQLQESFSYEFHRVGQPVIEIKSLGFVRVTPDGDLGLSTDFTELKSVHFIDYILVGTLVQTIDGVMVNAKLVGAKSHAIVAAAQQFIPQEFINNFISSKTNKHTPVKVIEPSFQTTKIKLVQGGSQ